MTELVDHNGRVIKVKKMGDMVKYSVDNKYYVIVSKHTPRKDVILLIERFYE